MDPRAGALIRAFGLQPHPEGGFYAGVHRSGAALAEAISGIHPAVAEFV